MNNNSLATSYQAETAEAAQRLRFVTATSLFDGHDAAINIMRRILQASGVEVIHLAHNCSVSQIVKTAIEEDVHGIAVSSYQGGHVEFFKYIIDSLRECGAGHIKVFGGGGGVIVPTEIQELEEYGVNKIYSPHDGMKLGLQGMIDDMTRSCITDINFEAEYGKEPEDSRVISQDHHHSLARIITRIEQGQTEFVDFPSRDDSRQNIPTLGITGTGGAGKSSLTDEIIRRFQVDSGDQLKIAVLAIDPTRRKTGGALLGDRVRMNSIYHPNIYFRSIATRGAGSEVPEYLDKIITAVKSFDFDLVIIETPGIGQGDAGIVPFVDTSMYVMTPEFGAQSQLEKIDMLDYADLVLINKFDRLGADDAYRFVAKQVQRNLTAFDQSLEELPVFGTIASHFNDDGVTAAYQCLTDILQERGLRHFKRLLPSIKTRISSKSSAVIPGSRQRYLAELAQTIRNYHCKVSEQTSLARECQQLLATKKMLQECNCIVEDIDKLVLKREEKLLGDSISLLKEWPGVKDQYQGDELHETKPDGSKITTRLISTSLSGNAIPRIALPAYEDHGEILHWLMRENLPGYFPYTAGVFPFKRESEDPTRMFAGEGDAFRTNRRFKTLSEHSAAKRLSTAFDSVTLYGADPDVRPDIYGKIGTSGVSIATLDDMKALFDGFDLCDPKTSVSMTINGPAPTVLAMFLNTAIDQQVNAFRIRENREPNESEERDLKKRSLSAVRGTVQADILKEDQGQNTCLFSTEFSLRMMGDIQQYFIDNDIRNFYSVSISGYHIAEAGANPISQLAFTLANGFTYVEAYLARGMHIDDFASNLSFFFSNGMDPEYTVMGRVARRIWAIAMKERYGANERSQRLKYHIQTSGRSLHAQEMNFNDIRTTLQALIAINDNCNSLHTNAYDEAVTTPTEDSVRRALAIQLIINQEFGLAKNENPTQGAFIITELTDLVEEAVLQEFERITERGGVLGAMELGYQRGKIQEESMLYEHKKHDGSLPIVGVNTFLGKSDDNEQLMELARSTEKEKQSQIKRLQDFKAAHQELAAPALQSLRDAVISNENCFDALIQATRHCSLGQITDLFFEVGGQYRRNM